MRGGARGVCASSGKGQNLHTTHITHAGQDKYYIHGIMDFHFQVVIMLLILALGRIRVPFHRSN